MKGFAAGRSESERSELERSELELVALLKEKIREQKQQMQTLGIPLEESHAAGAGYRPPQR